jgi:hypothetical protein
VEMGESRTPGEGFLALFQPDALQGR